MHKGESPIINFSLLVFSGRKLPKSLLAIYQTLLIKVRKSDPNDWRDMELILYFFFLSHPPRLNFVYNHPGHILSPCIFRNSRTVYSCEEAPRSAIRKTSLSQNSQGEGSASGSLDSRTRDEEPFVNAAID